MEQLSYSMLRLIGLGCFDNAPIEHGWRDTAK